MKVYYFMIIAVGLMFLFNLAGIETGSNQIFDLFQVNLNQTANIHPTVTATDITIIDNASTFWIALAAAILLFGATTIKISAGFASLQITTEAVLAALSGFIFVVFATDFLSILNYMRIVTGGTGWEFHLTWILIVPFLIGFALSIIQLIKGTE